MMMLFIFHLIYIVPSPYEEFLKGKEFNDTSSGCYIILRVTDYENNRIKIGRTGNLKARFNSEGYRNCRVLSYCIMEEELTYACENELKVFFNEHYTQIKDSDVGFYGTETFETNSIKRAVSDFNTITTNFMQRHEEETEVETETKINM